jgi:hypothetical protein
LVVVPKPAKVVRMHQRKKRYVWSQCTHYQRRTVADVHQKTAAKKAAPKKIGRATRVVDDSDDDEEEEVK